ncbi:MAG TPA: hypothetical protein VNA66_11430 [Gammaproteobacteria bacterium]|nr:hypothetical protein [Gammaproteobacteria bacterium]
MNFGQLKTQVIALAHYAGNTEVTAQAPRFVALAEGMIRRELTAMPLTVVLDDDDRDAEGVYDLPALATQVRAIYGTNSAGDTYALKQVSLGEIKYLSASASPINFAIIGDTIEFRGVPSEDDEFTVHYLGHPAALSADGDENDLLTNHEALYVYGALFYLYQFTQEPELAQGALDTFNDALRKLNAQVARKLAGARVASMYNFGPLGTHGY